MTCLRRTAAAVLSFAALLLVPGVRGAQDTTSPIVRAMQDELRRSMAELRIPDEPEPYYIEYEIEDRMASLVTARLGALVEDLSAPSRTLRVEVRVGDYAFDNSLFLAPDGGAGVIQLRGDGTTEAPLDDNYDVLRRQIWLATDAAYKRAVNVFARKKAAFQNRAAIADLPDFSREPSAETDLPPVAAALANREWPERVRQMSSLFLVAPGIDASDVAVNAIRGTRYYVNSEGGRSISPIEFASLRVSAEAHAADGMAIRDTFTITEKRLADLPATAELLARTRTFLERVGATRDAPLGEEYTGPVLVEGQASAELVGQALVPALLARRPPETPNPGRGQAQPTSFLRRIGLRVLSEPFSASDTPSLTSFDGHPVAGSYLVDDNGLRPKDVTLVEKGRLVTLLTGRTPLKGLPQSNGHWRSGAVQAGVFQLRSATAVPASALRQAYLDLLKTQDKPFGYIVRAVANPTDVAATRGPALGPVILDVVRVTPTGTEQPVRGLRFGAIPPSTFRDLLDASTERTLYSYRVGPSDIASVVVPNMIFEELEMQRPREVIRKPPIVPPPPSNLR